MRDAPHIDLSFRESEAGQGWKGTFSCDAFSAQRVCMVGTAPYDYCYKGGSHYLALHDIVRSDGESFVDGLPHKHVLDVRNKMTFIPEGCTVSGWTAPSRRLNAFLALYFDPEALARQVEDKAPRRQLAPAMYFEDAALLSTLSKIDELLRQPNPPDKLYAETLGLLAAVELYRVQNADSPVTTTIAGGLSQQQMQRLHEFMHARLHLAHLIHLGAATGWRA